MKEYKNEAITNVLFILTFLGYLLLPPVFMTNFCDWFNLNPFSIVNAWHFNPFSADRGIPFYQTFIYLFVMWIVVNLILWGGILLLFRLFRAYQSRRE